MALSEARRDLSSALESLRRPDLSKQKSLSQIVFFKQNHHLLLIRLAPFLQIHLQRGKNNKKKKRRNNDLWTRWNLWGGDYKHTAFAVSEM